MKNPLKLGIYFPICAGLGISAVTLRTVACLTSRDIFGYFPQSITAPLSAWLTVFCVLLWLTFPIARRSVRVRPLLFDDPISVLPTGLLAAAQFILCITLALALKPFSHLFSSLLSFVAGLFVIFGLLGCAYLAICLLQKEPKSSTRSFFGLFEIMTPALYAVYLYFDTYLPINATCKVTNQVFFLAFAVFLLADVRVSLDRPLYTWHTALSGIGLLLSAYAAVPSLLTLFLRGEPIDHSIYETIFVVSAMIFCAMRLFCLCRLRADEPSPLALVAIRLAEGSDGETEEAVEEEIGKESVEIKEETDDGVEKAEEITENAVSEGNRSEEEENA